MKRSDPTAVLDVDDTGSVELRNLAVDAGLCGLLVMVSIAGFEHAFGGHRFLFVGLVGVVAGLLVGALCAWRKAGPLLSMAAGVLGFVIASGPSVPADSMGGLIPGIGTPAALLHGLVHGWADVITTAPPVGTDHGMAVVPYTCAYVASIAGIWLAARSASPLVPALPAFLVLIITALMGTDAPPSLWVAAGWVAVAVSWGSLRSTRTQRVLGPVNWQRVCAAALMLVIVGGSASVVGPRLPGMGDTRVALRDDYEPPFDPRAYPSPLGGLRQYVTAGAKREVVFTVSGLRAGTPIRVATMDTYDGVVWSVGASGTDSGRFIRVGSTILPAPAGRDVTIKVTAGTYRGVWVPSVGATRSVAFTGPNAQDQADSLRYNRTTGVAATPAGVVEGDAYELAARIEDPPKRSELAKASIDGTIVLPKPPGGAAMSRRATEIVGDASSPFEKAEKLEKWFQSGYYSDGNDKDPQLRSSPGHSLFRLSSFFEKSVPSGTPANVIGNAEQYAASMASLARSIGLPARVVLGFRPKVKGSGPVEVLGSDVDAWVEVAFADYGWVSFRPTPDHNRKPRPLPDPTPIKQELAQQEPPPPKVLVPPSEAASRSTERPKAKVPVKNQGSDWSIPFGAIMVVLVLLIPVWLVLATCGSIYGFKRLRMKRRRTAARPVDRVAGAWREAIDRTRDLGLGVPRDATRNEVAELVPAAMWPTAPAFASEVDSVMFGPDEVDDAAASQVWAEAADHLRSMDSGLDRFARFKAACSIRSLRRLH